MPANEIEPVQPTLPVAGHGKGAMAAGAAGAAADAGGHAAGPSGGHHKVDKPRTYLPESEVKLPLEVETRCMCLWRKTNTYQRVRIVDRRPAADKPAAPTNYDYYVHYKGKNRRLDEWVSWDQIDPARVEVLPIPEDTGPVSGSNKKKRARISDSSSGEEEEDHGPFDANAIREHEEVTKVKNIETIEMGRYELDTWYFSPMPPELRDARKLYVCDFSLHFFTTRAQLQRHLRKCPVRHPPGEEIYRNGNVSMFEIDGRKEKQYCQNLCLLAKLFLDHKTLYYDVDLFLFYVLCESDDRGAHIVGYFSKEKNSEDGNNLACILTLPSYQRKGYGKFLISFSYELSKIEGRVGSPERPLSDLGLVSYKGYWTRVLLGVLRDREGTISVKELSEMTCMKVDDILFTLGEKHLNLIQFQKGSHVICVDPRLVEKYLKEAGSEGLAVDPAKIVWTPYNAEREYQNYRL